MLGQRRPGKGDGALCTASHGLLLPVPAQGSRVNLPPFAEGSGSSASLLPLLTGSPVPAAAVPAAASVAATKPTRVTLATKCSPPPTMNTGRT